MPECISIKESGTSSVAHENKDECVVVSSVVITTPGHWAMKLPTTAISF